VWWLQASDFDIDLELNDDEEGEDDGKAVSKAMAICGIVCNIRVVGVLSISITVQ
jgi:hypothetical protein